MALLNPFPIFLIVLLSTRTASEADPESATSTAMASMPSPELSRHTLVKGLVEALLGYGGYAEITDLLVNLTSMADKIGRLALEAQHGLTLLAPNDKAMAGLGPDQLADPNLPERLLHYHVIAEYLTEESLYVHTRRLGKTEYSTLLVPLTVRAEEADGTVKVVGGGGSWGHLIDADIYANGIVSVQGINGVLFPSVASQRARSENH